MFQYSRQVASGFVGAALGCSVLAISSTTTVAQPAASAQFSDVNANYWARPFIEELASKDIIKGFPDGSFKPNEPVTRAQFAAIVRQAFDQPKIRRANRFKDVDANFWATPAISQAYTTGFLSGYPGNEFQPKQRIPKVQALVALASGLQLEPQGQVAKSLGAYNDAAQIPDYAESGIAAATETGIVVNHPNVKFLNPNDNATRADIAAFVYQALVNQKQLEPLAKADRANRFIVEGLSTPAGTQAPATPATVAKGTGRLMASGTKINLKYIGSDKAKLVLAPGETLPVSFGVANNVVNSQNVVLIPKGSTISGQIVPFTVNSTTGAQFVAQTLKIGANSYPISAISNPVVPAARQSVTPTAVQDSLTTTAARTALGSILGGGGLNPTSILTNVLLNQGAQSLRTTGSAPTTTSDSVIILDPAQLVLTTQSDVNLTAAKTPGS
ncbi:MAG: S-layer homology domain-containing protein [Cyanobacteria bacterium P01_A01_bin.17]